MIQNSSDKKFIQLDERNNPLMTIKTLKFYCLKQSFPSEPQLNETLYLQYKGFQKIIPQTISLYTNLKVLHLNNNGISKIQGLHMLRELNHLYLNNNFIQKIDGLQELINLKVLNLSHNKIDFVNGLQSLQNLRNINLSENFLTKAKDLQGLIQLNRLSQLNLSQNQIQASQQVFQVITQLENLTILYLKSTPLSNLFKNYRKRTVYKLKKLKFLDNRPVLPNDHQLAQAWAQGGIQKERQLKSKIIEEKRQQNQRQMHQQSKKGQQKIEKQRKKLDQIKPIIYQKSEKPVGQQGLNCAYLPKKQSKLDEYLSCSLYQHQNKKPIEHNEKLKQKHADQSESIYKKVQQVFGNNIKPEQEQQQQVKLQRVIQKKWSKKYKTLLQQLLMKYKFDFSEVQPSLNMIISNINKRLMKPVVRFEIKELRYIWTQIEKEKRVEEAKTLKENERKAQFIDVK